MEVRRRLEGLLALKEVVAEAGESGGVLEELEDGVEARVVDAVDEEGERGSASGAALSRGGGVAESVSEGVVGVGKGEGGVICLMERNTFLSSRRASLMSREAEAQKREECQVSVS